MQPGAFKTSSLPTAAPHAEPGRQASRRGMLWMVAAMAAFAVEDVLVKQAARSLPVGQVLVLFGLGGALLFAAVAGWQRSALWRPAAGWAAVALRAVFELVGRLFYMLALALTPLSSATAILQATPVLVVLAASLWLRERVGPLRWLAVGLGLLGVLVVLQPASGDFSALSWLAVVGMLGFAGRDLASRAMPASVGTAQLGFYGFATVVLAGLLFGMWDGRAFVVPGLQAGLQLAAASAVGAAAYACLMKAMRTGDVASVTPFRYTRMLFGVGLGVLVFDEQLSPALLLGCTVIVAAGLLILWEGRRR